ncbi:restriction endonuclease subunit S [Bifidobacterium mongoliense]|uniref:restriction endonuclease subunit S n=1 Tax=Bifidobacterium mongoliense TaxID=518643 RepID=UPI0030ED4649
MTDDTSRVPKLRFPGFAGAWEQRKLGSVIEERNIQQAQSRKYPLVSFTVEQGVTPKTKRYEREQLVVGDKASKKYKITEYNDIVYNPANLKFGAISRNTYGNAVFSPIYVTFVVDLEVASPSFIGLFVTRQDFIQRSLMYQQGTVYERQSVNPEDLLSMNCYLPSRPEQESISLLFGQLDDLITLHQRKLSHLRELKRGLLQKMFPKSGEDRPEVRFPGFVDAWEQRKLGDIADVVGGGTPDTGNPDYWNGDIDWYAPAEIGESVFVSESQRKITTLGLRKSSAKMLPPGTILFTSRAGIGNTAILAVSACTNQGFQSIVPHPEVADSYFIFARSSQLKRYGEKVGAGSTFVEVSGKQMSKMPLRVPVLQEQCRIGTLFRQIDDLIALHQRKLSHLQQQKKALLQQMFV